LVSPLLQFFQTPLWGRTLLQITLTAIAIGAGVAVGMLTFSALGQWRQFRRGERMIADMDVRLSKLLDRASATGAKADESIGHSSDLLEGILAVMRQKLPDIPEDAREAYIIKLAEAERHLASVRETHDEQRQRRPFRPAAKGNDAG
jgi:hypothetical protein